MNLSWQVLSHKSRFVVKHKKRGREGGERKQMLVAGYFMFTQRPIANGGLFLSIPFRERSMHGPGNSKKME